MKFKYMKNAVILVLTAVMLVACLSACQLKEPSNDTLFYINKTQNDKNLHDTKKKDAIDNVTGGIENLREYVKDSSIATTGYYMGVTFNINTVNAKTKVPSNFKLDVKAHLYTNQYLDDEGHRTYQFKKIKGTYESTKYNAFYYNNIKREYMYYDNLFYAESTSVTGGTITGVSKYNHYDRTITIPAGEFVDGEDYFDTKNKTCYKKTSPLLNGDAEVIMYYYETTSKEYVDVTTVPNKIFVDSEEIHNEVIKKSDIQIEWYNGDTNEVLLGFYFDGLNGNIDDPGNILYLDIQGDRETGARRCFVDFGDTVLYRQLVRLLMNLSVEKLLIAGNIQGDAGVADLGALLNVAITDNYKVVFNNEVTSTFFYGVNADLLAKDVTKMIQDLFATFENKIDPLTLKYLGFRFSVMGVAIVNSINADMQFFTQVPEGSDNSAKILSGAKIDLNGVAVSNGELYDYTSDVAFTYGAYPPEPLEIVNRDRYTYYDYGNYEFTGNLYIPMLDSNYDALIRTDVNQYDNKTNNVYMTFTDIANGELMAGIYYKNELTYLDITGMEYLYGSVDLEDLGFPKVFDGRLNLAKQLSSFFKFINNGIISIVDGILSPDQSDKESKLLQYIMDKTFSTEKIEGDIFSKNTVTILVDMELIKNALRETGVGEYTTRDIINILDTMSPYTMDQIATILGVASAEVMLDNSYFTFTINTDTNELTIKMFTNVGVKEGEPSIMIFQLDLQPKKIGEYVKIAEVSFDGFKPLGEIYTYSATMSGNFIFSTQEEVDLSKLLAATIGENSGLNTHYVLSTKAGLSFNLIYDQYVTDQLVDGVLKKAGRSSFTLSVYLTGDEGSILFELASDDVAFNNEVYKGLPGTARELGYVWVNIQCVYQGTERKIPQVKIREDIFMSSMQAYMQGSSISDDVSNLGASDVNLSITSILMALVKDSYVVLQPEQIEITTSNETVQNIFRVDSLIGNIAFDAGFRYRVKGLENVKHQYGLYHVGMFDDMKEYSPYTAELKKEIGTYFYEDYMDKYNEFDNDFRIATENGNKLQVYEKGGKVTIVRDEITNDSGSFFEKENAENQNINKVRFLLSTSTAYTDNKFITVNSDLGKIVFKKDDGKYYYTDYAGEEKEIADKYVFSDTEKLKDDSGKVIMTKITVYIYYNALKEVVFYEGGKAYYFFDADKAVVAEDKINYVFIDIKVKRNLLFEYDKGSIEVTEAAKTQYAPRINGSFMGAVRRYILEITSPRPVDRGKVESLSNTTYYSDADRDNVVEIFDKNGVKISEENVPIPVFVMEPSDDLLDNVDVQVHIGAMFEKSNLPAHFVIDWNNVTLKGDMLVTEVIVAEGTMGERRYPVRIIVTNREIVSQITNGTSIYATEQDILTENVSVVDTISVDPYDFILKKYEFFKDTANYNPSNLTTAEYLKVFKQKEVEFINKYFSTFQFTIMFDFLSSNLVKMEVKDEYIAKSYTNKKTTTVGGSVTTTMEEFNWFLDRSPTATNNIERNISPLGSTIFLHTYFHGQLIALRVEVGVREFDHLKFSKDDAFTPVEGGKIEPTGHYIANYFDSGSYTIDKHPIFVFRDERGVLYERTFDMDYVYNIDANGNYNVKQYGTNWANPEITNIGSNGSYYKPTSESEFINRPFYISNVVRDENGQVISEELPTPTENDSDITTATLDLRYILSLFKYNNGEKLPINIIGGDANSDWFSTIVLRIKVECPKQDIDSVKLTDVGGTTKDKVVEIDEVNSTQGNERTFNLTAGKIGNNKLGYYEIDPLNADSLIIPRQITLYFVNKDGTRVANGHTFKNIVWYSWKDGEFGEDVVVYHPETDTYRFNCSTERPLTTRIMARIGNDIAGYDTITIAVKVLSKEPKSVEFFQNASISDSSQINGIQQSALTTEIGEGDTNATKYIEYKYYVDSFANFPLPTHLRVTFGTDEALRTVIYTTNWRMVNGDANIVFRPNSVVNLVTTIGDNEDVEVDIYLTVTVANHKVSQIEMLGEHMTKYVLTKRANNYEYVLLGELFTQNLERQEIGFDDGLNHIVVSLGRPIDNGVEQGKIGLFTDNGTNKVMSSEFLPYDFIQKVYSKVNIKFKNVELVDIWNINDDYENSYVFLDNGLNIKLQDVTKFVYSYDAFGKMYETKLVLQSAGGVKVRANNGKIAVYPNNSMSESEAKYVDIRHLTSVLVQMDMARPINEWTVKSVAIGEDLVKADVDTQLKNMFVFRNGKLVFINPSDKTDWDIREVTFADGSSIKYDELYYRLDFLSNYRVDGYAPNTIYNKEVSIENLYGIFQLNDVIIDAQNADFKKSNKYKIILGKGNGSYDIKLNILFADGIRLSDDGASVSGEEVNGYNYLGVAEYGDTGYVLGEKLSANVAGVKQDGTGEVVYYSFNSNGSPLKEWYVERSDFPEIAVGTLITKIPQSVVYSGLNGEIQISVLTENGFRLTRVLSFNGVPDNLTNYNSTGSSLLPIDNGTITIKNVYDYVEINEVVYKIIKETVIGPNGEPVERITELKYRYNDLAKLLGQSSSLPTSLELRTGKQTIRVSDVKWTISEAWYKTSIGANDKPIETGDLADMNYNGTYNQTAGEVNKVLMATTKLLGWTSVENGVTVYHDQITLQVMIKVESAEVSALPWEKAGPFLNTMTLNEKEDIAGTLVDKKVFVVDIDAFNNEKSNAITGDKVNLSSKLRVMYKDGAVNIFDGVRYKYRTLYEISSIPYNIKGINVEKLANSLGIDENSIDRRALEVKVDLGLGQVLNIRYNFFDKTIESTTAVINFDDQAARDSVAKMFDNSEYANLLKNSFNLTRIDYNVTNIIKQARSMRNSLVMPKATDMKNKSVEEVKKMFADAILALKITATPVFPTTTAYSDESCYVFAYRELIEIYNQTYEILTPKLMNELANMQLEKAQALIDEMVVNVFNITYEQVIGNYMEGEVVRALYNEMSDMSVDELNSAINFKNMIEAKIDVDGLVKALAYQHRYHTARGFDKASYTLEAKKLITEYITAGLSAVKKGYKNLNATFIATIEEAFLVQIGLKSAEGSLFNKLPQSVDAFIDTYCAVANPTLKAMREGFKDTLAKCLYISNSSVMNDILIPNMLKDNFNNNVGIENSVKLIKNSLLNGMSISSSLRNILDRSVDDYFSLVYSEMQIVTAMRRAIANNNVGDLYFIDPYFDYIIIPTKYVLDFAPDVNLGGYSYNTVINWNNDKVTGKVNYKGNAKADYVAYINTYRDQWAINDKLNNAQKQLLLSKYNEQMALCTTWEALVEGNPAIYNTLMGIFGLLNLYFNYDDMTEAQKLQQQKTDALSLYCQFRAMESILALSEGELLNDGFVKVKLTRVFEGFKYDLLTANIKQSNTNEIQSVSLLVKVFDKEIDEGDVEIKKEGSDTVYTEYIVDNPFEQTVKDIPNKVTIGGIVYDVKWKNVTISPSGNLDVADKTVYGNIKTDKGQQVKLKLVVNKWEYIAMRKEVTVTVNNPDGSVTEKKEYKYMNPINIYTSKYLTYSAEDKYQLSFKIYKEDGSSEIVFKEFYPEDSRLLENTTDDAGMQTVNEYKKYMIYWDEYALNNAKNGTSVPNGSLSIGNEVAGRINIETLASKTNTVTATKANYYFEDMFLDGVNLSTDIDKNHDLYLELADGLFGNKTQSTVVVDVNTIFPMTGEVKFYENYVHYKQGEVKVRLLWNKTYEVALGHLKTFVSRMYDGLTPAEIDERAKAILLNVDRSKAEEQELVNLAKEYIVKYEMNLTAQEREEYLKSARSTEDANQLLMIHEKYDYSKKTGQLKGAVDSTKTVSVVIRVGANPYIYTKNYSVRTVFTDLTPKAYFADDADKSQISTISANLKEMNSLFIGVRREYWDKNTGKNGYQKDNLFSRYDTDEPFIYKMLQLRSDGLTVSVKNGYRLLKVTNVVFGEAKDGVKRSVSFVLNGKKYDSDLISIRVG